MSSELAHSKLGASSSDRWMTCPGSVKLSEGIPSRSSAFAEEGTLAHEIAAEALTTSLWPKCDPEMKDHLSIYIDTIHSDTQSLGGEAPLNKLLIEHRFDLSELHPGMFGTADCVAFDPSKKLLRVYDLKYGQGIAVDVVQNSQLMYYGLGALLSTGYPCSEVELVIVQPRCPHPDGAIRRWRFSAISLLDFAADLVDAAKKTTEPDAPLVPGEHCRFCPAAGICPEVYSKALALAKEEFSPTLSYDQKKLSQVLSWLDTLDGWAKSVREFAYAEALHGRYPPGWKLVEKRATRKWANEDEATSALPTMTGLASDQIFEKSIKSPAQIEKLIPKHLKPNLETLVIKKSSGLTLVHESDPRPATQLDIVNEFDVIDVTVKQGEN